MTTSAAGAHDRWEELAVGSALHALEPAEEAEFRQHLVDCAPCQDAEIAMAEVTAQLALAVESVEPPGRLRAAVLAASATTPEVAKDTGVATGVAGVTPISAGRRPRRRSASAPWRRPWIAAAAAAAIVVALAGGVTVWARGGGNAIDRNAVVRQCAQDRGCRSLALTAADGHQGRALVRGQSVTLVVQGLPVSDPSRSTYVLWQRQRTGDVHAMGTFDVTRPITVTPSLPLRDAAEAAGLAVTNEPGRTAPAVASGPILASADL